MMTAAAQAPDTAAEATAPPPREWWQLLAARRVRWAAAHPKFLAVWRRARAVALWAGLVWLAGVVIFMPQLRLGMAAYVGCLWVVIAWFLVAGTKTLTWGGYMRFFAACIPWSAGVGVLSTVLALGVAEGFPGGEVIGVGFAGSSTAIAGIVEEAAKLLPVLLVGLAAPRRAARFAAVDWLLLGVASGTAFLAVEEVVRRTVHATGGGGVMATLRNAAYEGGLPPGFVQFGWWPVPTPNGSGDAVSLVTTEAQFGGHAIMTALVTGLGGLALAAWQTRRRSDAAPARPPAGRLLAGGLLGVATVGMFWSVIADHVMNNAALRLTTALPADDGTPAWLHPQLSTLPGWLREPWQLLGEGHGRPVVFLVLVAVCLLVDASRQASPAASLTGTSFGPLTALGRARRPGGRLLIGPLLAVVHAVVAWVWITVRDVGQVIAGFSRQPGEPRRAALARGVATVAGQRALRELALEHAHARIHPWVRRLAVLAAIAVLVWMILVLAPATATRIGPDIVDVEAVVFGGDWLAGVLDSIAAWWHAQPLAVKILLGVAIGAAIVASGGSLALGIGLSGGLLSVLDNASGIASLIRDPRQTTRDYFTTATPAQIALDVGGLALNFLPGGIGAAGGRIARGVADDIITDPSAWVAARRHLLHESGERGSIPLPGKHPRDPADLIKAHTYDIDGSLYHVDALGRPAGTEATLTRKSIENGHATDPKVIPLGFNSDDHQAGHLLAAQFGGRNDHAANFVSQFDRANNPWQRMVEREVRKVVDSGETVTYKTTPKYDGDNVIPAQVDLHARGSGGYRLDYTVPNRDLPLYSAEVRAGNLPKNEHGFRFGTRESQ